MPSPLKVKCFYKVSFYWDILGAFHLERKKTEISVGAKEEFPIGKKLFHLVVMHLSIETPTPTPGQGGDLT